MALSTPLESHVPEHGWKVRLDYRCSDDARPFTTPRLSQIGPLTKMSIRYMTKYYLPRRREHRKPVIDGVSPLKWRPIFGVPLGGIGGGTIGRGFRGEFCRYQMVPGMYEHEVVYANQFIVTIRKRGTVVYQQVLYPSHPPSSEMRNMSGWNWDFCPEHAYYCGLYPRAWTVYEIPGQKIRLICRQISPVIPHDYQDSSLPLSVFVWRVINYGTEPVDVTLTLTMKNGQGVKTDNAAGDVSSEPFTSDGIKGCLIHQVFRDMNCTYALGARNIDEKQKVTVLPGFSLSSKRRQNLPNAQDMWKMLLTNGMVTDSTTRCESVRAHDDLVCAVSTQCEVAPGDEGKLEFVLAWHMPLVRFRRGEITYTRRYVRWFNEDTRTSAKKLISYALENYSIWEDKIEAWQRPILDDNSLPDWYKSAIFNELYFVSDGGTVWLDPVEPHTLPKIEGNLKKEMGYFGYLEGHEYRMFNTYDVHYYASWAMIKLWPKIQLAIQYDFAHTTISEDQTMVHYLHSGVLELRSAKGYVPHDLGDPEDEPWLRVNAYIAYNTDLWKDLNPKFVLQVWRDWKLTGDEEYLRYMTPVVLEVMKCCLQWDTDGDGIIDNGGYADQTFDMWTATGASAYTGGIWLGALYAACELMDATGMDSTMLKAMLEKGKASFQKLWTGSYYRYDSGRRRHSTSIMSDQLNGHWYLRSCGVPDDAIFPREQVRLALKTISNANVEHSGKGARRSHIGAINGMMPNHTKDISSVQSEEFWVGVNYALAAAMILEGLPEDGLRVAQGSYETTYGSYGLQFQTPEAYLDNGRFRSLGYMRPLSIWAIQHAIETKGVDWRIPTGAPAVLPVGAEQNGLSESVEDKGDCSNGTCD